MEINEEGKTPVHVRKELLEYAGSQEALVELLEGIAELARDTAYVTCIVYLRGYCHMCMMMRMKDKLFEWVNQDGYEILAKQKDTAQFWRQVVIWVKEWVEEEMKKPCSLENVSQYVH